MMNWKLCQVTVLFSVKRDLDPTIKTVWSRRSPKIGSFPTFLKILCKGNGCLFVLLYSLVAVKRTVFSRKLKVGDLTFDVVRVSDRNELWIF